MSILNKILVILGPTSSGKSDIAIKLAKKFSARGRCALGANGAEIISADSRQIYRSMDIGTGKILRDKKSLALGNSTPTIHRGGRKKPSFDLKKVYFSQGIPHYMIDIVSPRADYNVAKFKKQAEIIIEDILRRGKLPIICGGTGFWIQAIVNNVNFPNVKPDWKLRKKLEKYSAEILFSMLKKLDLNRAKNIDAKNKVRLIRAIEIAKALGKVPKIPTYAKASVGKQNTKYKIPDAKYDFLQIGLKLPKDKLYKNIEKRVMARFNQGMIAEVKKLQASGLSWKKIQSFGLAYYWIPLYLQNKLSKEELIDKVIQAEKNYAKRQTTWFKRDKRIKWLKNYKTIENAAKIFLK